MKTEDMIATAHITINAPVASVWEALTNPAMIKKYMFGTTVVSGWREGDKIVWKGEWKGKSYEDKGEILAFEPGRKLQYTHYSPMSGQPDIPENYHTVTILLTDKKETTYVVLTQDNNPTDEAREHSEEGWMTMLSGLKKLLD